jgi:hypothetical protein
MGAIKNAPIEQGRTNRQKTNRETKKLKKAAKTQGHHAFTRSYTWAFCFRAQYLLLCFLSILPTPLLVIIPVGFRA